MKAFSFRNLLSFGQKFTSSNQRRARRTERSFEGVADVELLEPRQMMTASAAIPVVAHTAPMTTVQAVHTVAQAQSDWFSDRFSDAGVANAVRNDYYAHNNHITRSDVLGIFSQVEQDGYVSTNEFQSLQSLVNNSANLSMSSDVANLTYKTVDGNVASQFAVGYQGNLHAGSSSQALVALSNEYFYGSEHMGGTQAISFSQASGSLFGSSGAPQYTDISQGQCGDCTLLASMAEIALRNSSGLKSSFVNNGDGTYAVRFFQNGSADWVTVNSNLPSGGNLYDHPVNGVLWAALMEKAVVQVNEEGWLGSYKPGVNSYSAIDGGNAGTASAYLSAISGASASSYSINPTDVATAWQQGKYVVLLSNSVGDMPYVVHNHAYAMTGYNSSASLPYSFFNPWGAAAPQSGAVEFVNMNAAALNQYYQGYVKAGSEVSSNDLGGTVSNDTHTSNVVVEQKSTETAKTHTSNSHTQLATGRTNDLQFQDTNRMRSMFTLDMDA